MPRNKLDEVNLKIIQSLKRDPRRSITSLAKDASISRPTAMIRLRRMIERGTIGIEVGLNLKEQGFLIGRVGLEVKGVKSRSEMLKVLENCPRVLMILRPFEKTTFSTYLFGEDQETLRSTIHGLNEFPNTNVTYVNYSSPPLYPKTFPIQITFNKRAVAPCGRRCGECFSYKDDKCVGCPAVLEYRGCLG